MVNVNVISFDPRPTETVMLDNAYTNLPSVAGPVVPFSQQLAECLLAHKRVESVAALYDMLAIADTVDLSSLDELAGVCAETFGLLNTSWPPEMPPPIAARRWDELVRTFGLRWSTPADAHRALTTFWQPVFGRAQPRTFWHADVWDWE